MSADLQFRLPIIKIPPTSDKTETTDSDSCLSEEDCVTPKSPEHMIPAVLRCPSPPRKPLRRLSCKRKLRELKFFEVVAKDEIDSFFRRAEETLSGGGAAAKRRCLV